MITYIQSNYMQAVIKLIVKQTYIIINVLHKMYTSNVVRYKIL